MSAAKKISIRSASAMHRLGKCLGQFLRPGDFLGLQGPLGAGKTVLVRGIAQGAQVNPQEVASPSYAIVYPYQGRILIHHADLYRVEEEEELYSTGFYDLLGGESAVIVEWIDRVPQAMPSEGVLLTIERLKRGRRVIFAPQGARAEQLVEQVLEVFRDQETQRSESKN